MHPDNHLTMQRFEFLLKNEKTKSYHRIATWLILIHIAVFILFAIDAENDKTKIICLAGALIASLCLILHFYFNPLNKNFYQYTAMCVAIIGWLLLSKWLAVIACVFLLWLYIVSVKPLTVRVSADEVQFVSFPARVLKWQELNNVILKDDILTIDLKNNKILQVEIEANSLHSFEEEFNDFCRQQLKVKSV